MTFSRMVIWIALAGVTGADVVCVTMGWQTISSAVRQLDAESGTLLRWLLLALWGHWFVLSWPFVR